MCVGNDTLIETLFFLPTGPPSSMHFAARACACLLALQVRFDGRAPLQQAPVDARQQGLRLRGREAGREGVPARAAVAPRARAKNIARRALRPRFSTETHLRPSFPPHSWPPPGRCSVPPCWAVAVALANLLPPTTPRRPTRAAAWRLRPPSRLRSRRSPLPNSTSKSSSPAPCPSCRSRSGRIRSCRRCRSRSLRRRSPNNLSPSRWPSLRSRISRCLRSRLLRRTG